ncbi:hypothetical protein VP01_5630g1, partial [Puccinia sorghi]
LPQMNVYPVVNSILVIGNTVIHCFPRVAALCKTEGVRLIYLPPYCPELKPIEVCFSQVKSHLHRTQGLVNATDTIWVIHCITTHSVVSPDLCHELYCHKGYNCSLCTNDDPLT